MDDKPDTAPAKKPFDARSLNDKAIERLRESILRDVTVRKLPKADAARAAGVSRQYVYKVLALAAPGGAGLAPARRGPKPGVHGALDARQAQALRRDLADRCPEQLKLPFVLWTAEAVRSLIRARHGVEVGLRAVRAMLARWGFTLQRPARRASERDDAAVERFKREEYPAVKAEAAKAGAVIYWFDESGLRGDAKPPRGYAPRGKGHLLVEPARDRHARVNILAALDPAGRMAFRCVRTNVDAEVFIDFLKRLSRHAGGRPVRVVLDNLRVHHSKAVRAYVESTAGRTKLVFIPPYAPEINPVELLNNDVKTNFVSKVRPGGADGLEAAAAGFLRAVQRRPKAVRAYFRAEETRFAAEWECVA